MCALQHIWDRDLLSTPLLKFVIQPGGEQKHSRREGWLPTEASDRNCNWSAVSRCSSHVLDLTFASATFPPACSDADADGDSCAEDDGDDAGSDAFVAADE